MLVVNKNVICKQKKNNNYNTYFKNPILKNYPCGPVVKTSPSNAGVVDFIPHQETEIPHGSWPKIQNIKAIL